MIDIDNAEAETNLEPLVHSHLTDSLPESHPLAHRSVRCKKCEASLHSAINECMQTWLETQWGNYCVACFRFGPVLEPPPVWESKR